ncbi:uncharacterized protein L969DRAFT_90952 [Mixia osmundae IAM 14324]|uniref:Tryptophan synthase n=1 Tax=Mixia osmundae (strain CBS 9802 / IAM 14324 / JCM 22182 / KY 12970) TaxID=764103 RepID=G7EB38_MIXOS|nr:uncharacterized protein L969DRAFT_90952 [Mixia osmundae IAM 14324]KEI36582.1 hypothetical protein L969DRAFT_90952 [Mixia osmundae IAM 14324]GAB00049.1 hypothetical protein E5Q_06751 [Mixia osmundae IAM 14324]
MATALKDVFAARAELHLPVFVTFMTAGYPHPDKSVDIMLAMEAGGADIIELGVPFTDPLADGKAIQESNNVALEHDCDYTRCLEIVKEARARGLKCPVILMGYYNPLLAYDTEYGTDKAVVDARAAGVSGFIVVDLPPEEAIEFRKVCTSNGLSYVPLIAPSTTDARIRFLGSIADSFIYVVSKMGTTGAASAVNTDLPNLVNRIETLLDQPIPLAVGFGVSTHEHFDQVGSVADGVVVGSKLIAAVEAASKESGDPVKAVRDACESICGGRARADAGVNRQIQRRARANGKGVNGPGNADVPTTTTARATTNGIKHITPIIDGVVTDETRQTVPGLDSIPQKDAKTGESAVLPPRFGEFGGQYVPEALVDCLAELEQCFKDATADPAFWAEWESYYNYMNRPSNLYEAKRLTEKIGGARIWFKREDLNHTGSHKINNAVGQILLAKRIGKKRIIAETGAGQHGVATATVCAKLGLECVVYMGAEDVRRQALNVFRMKMLGAKVVAVASGSQTLKDAINEAMRDWVTNLSTTHFLIGSAIGPHPFPTIVREFQSVIGKEIKWQLQEAVGRLPDAVVACVGGGSNAIGTFYPFQADTSVRLVGVEAGGEGVDTPYHSATLSKGTKGVLHGVRTYLLQSNKGQIIGTHSISAGLDYSGVGPQHAFLKDSGRAEYTAATDLECLKGFRLCTENEGIIPALETAHAIWGACELAKTMPKDANIVLCLSGRGDKDVEQIADQLPKYAERLDWHLVN